MRTHVVGQLDSVFDDSRFEPADDVRPGLADI